MCAVLIVEVVEVGFVLEVVSVDFAAFYNVVRLNIVGKLFDIECYVFLCKNFFCNSKNLGMRCGRSSNSYFLSLK